MKTIQRRNKIYKGRHKTRRKQYKKTRRRRTVGRQRGGMRRTTADEYIVVEEIPGEGEAFFSVLPVTPGDRDEQLKETAEYLGAQAWVWARLANTDTVPASDMEEIVTLLIKKYPMIFQPQLMVL